MMWLDGDSQLMLELQLGDINDDDVDDVVEYFSFVDGKRRFMRPLKELEAK